MWTVSSPLRLCLTIKLWTYGSSLAARPNSWRLWKIRLRGFTEPPGRTIKQRTPTLLPPYSQKHTGQCTDCFCRLPKSWLLYCVCVWCSRLSFVMGCRWLKHQGVFGPLASRCFEEDKWKHEFDKCMDGLCARGSKVRILKIHVFSGASAALSRLYFFPLVSNKLIKMRIALVKCN